MPNKSPRVFSREFKLEAVRRILAGERIRALSDELKVLRKDLYAWRDLFRAGGAAALRPLGRPRKGEAVVPAAVRKRARDIAAADPGAPERIAELERKIGQQQIELDFFRQALRRVKEARRPSSGPGVTGSTRSSRR
ncbi:MULTISPECIES: helix-turn-helix domain-containing protein [Bradyrhizobium]|uniref:Helix-turn-helix domain-containing protein n=3 Tax=Bradyrhizobium elkanii TaxID=29448 RepID=A0A4U6RAC9_BRAEL|nr:MULTISPECIES: helix-turn-helix domain-containing protein [Bradyrhizobium]MTV14814.1 helix-turn-helix domain-containing protein [Bradyrhizobium sp. BR2003]MTV15348.1 helix-turn-helix domain-containing protein [Bradyrhizobium sp. BR2003]MTV18174.1 helix-turn-helix domain-containing protein [Bradyrhizobium sp. BR2003]MTV18507.1 helix-turn-helix domain-containing protein [Bradyrhizobium sp. BR2003]TKV70844.1 helix-turn-helix domain-containing protein [Bradyrhizobium elkanii]